MDTRFLCLDQSGSTQAQVGSFKQQILHPNTHTGFQSDAGTGREEAGSCADGSEPSRHAGGLSGRDLEEVKGEDWNVEESGECLQKAGVRTDNTGIQEEESGKTLSKGTSKIIGDWCWLGAGI